MVLEIVRAKERWALFDEPGTADGQIFRKDQFYGIYVRPITRTVPDTRIHCSVEQARRLTHGVELQIGMRMRAMEGADARHQPLDGDRYV